MKASKNLKHGINATALTIIVIAGVVIVNLILSTLNGKFPLDIDLTRDKIYEISQQTKDTMKALDKDVTAYVMAREGESGGVTDDYLDRYRQLSSHFKVEYVDPQTNPTFVKKYEESGDTISQGNIIIECGDNYNIVTANQMYSSTQNATYIDVEKKITQAILNVTGEAVKTNLYVVEGHGESDITVLEQLLEDNSYTVEKINLLTDEIPEDTGAIICTAPARDYTAEEIEKMDRYVDTGGNLFFYLFPGMQGLERLNSYLNEWGITVNNGIIIEMDPQMSAQISYGLPLPLPQMEEHEITQKLIDQGVRYISDYQTCDMDLNDTNAQRAILTPLLTTSESSYRKSGDNIQTLNKEEGDGSGPFNLAVLAERENEDHTMSRVFVVGGLTAINSDWIMNDASYANSDFTLNSFAYVTEKEDALNIRAKAVSVDRLNMTLGQYRTTMVILWAIPFALIILGIVIWYRRRYL